eukprot:292390-Lingulodinium_polyedra.AAC.1
MAQRGSPAQFSMSVASKAAVRWRCPCICQAASAACGGGGNGRDHDYWCGVGQASRLYFQQTAADGKRQ